MPKTWPEYIMSIPWDDVPWFTVMTIPLGETNISTSKHQLQLQWTRGYDQWLIITDQISDIRIELHQNSFIEVKKLITASKLSCYRKKLPEIAFYKVDITSSSFRHESVDHYWWWDKDFKDKMVGGYDVLSLDFFTNPIDKINFETYAD